MAPFELDVQDPSGATRTHSLGANPLTMGRAPGIALSFPADAALSRRHLAIEPSENGWLVRDLASKNGTFLNGRRITNPETLRPGDHITAGRVRIHFRTAQDAGSDRTVIFLREESTKASNTVSTDLDGAIERSPTARSSAKSIQILIRAGQELATHRPIEDLLRTILELSTEAVGAARALLMLAEGEEYAIRATHGEQFTISTSVRDRVLNERTSLLVHDAQIDPGFAGSASIIRQGMRSIIAVPLQTRERVLGLLYVDSQGVPGAFTEEDLSLMTVLANVAAIRIEQARLNRVEQAEMLHAKELAQAAEIQNGLLPSAPPNIPGLDIAGRNLPCRTVGGDFYNFFQQPDGRVGLVIADVAGKGMPAALMVSNLQAYLEVFLQEGGDPAGIVERLNRSLAARCPDNRFITLFLALIDPGTGAIEYCNAGHNPPLLVRAGGEVEELIGGGLILGILPRATYETRRANLNIGDTLALYSDGVTEACPPAGEEEFGEARLGKLLAKNHAETAETTLSCIFEELLEWTRNTGFTDDVTVIVARRV